MRLLTIPNTLLAIYVFTLFSLIGFIAFPIFLFIFWSKLNVLYIIFSIMLLFEALISLIYGLSSYFIYKTSTFNKYSVVLLFLSVISLNGYAWFLYSLISDDYEYDLLIKKDPNKHFYIDDIKHKKIYYLAKTLIWLGFFLSIYCLSFNLFLLLLVSFLDSAKNYDSRIVIVLLTLNVFESFILAFLIAFLWAHLKNREITQKKLNIVGIISVILLVAVPIYIGFYFCMKKNNFILPKEVKEL